MARKISIKKNVDISSIEITVPNCPGCGHEHSFRMSRPETTRNCSYQTGTFRAILKPSFGHLDLSIKFTGGPSGDETDITERVSVAVEGVTIR
jgi:hypothetical protein